MADNPSATEIEVTLVEAELCRIQSITAVRIVTGAGDQLEEVHVLAVPDKPAKQIVRDIQSVAMAAFGLDIDRRIVSVVQLAPEAPGTTGSTTRPRPQIVGVETRSDGRRTTIQVTIRRGGEERTGFAEGSAAASVRPQVVAEAALDALRQLEPDAETFDVDTAATATVGTHEIALVVLVSVEPHRERHLCGSAIIRQHLDDAVVRAVFDATNRQLGTSARRDH